MFGKIFFSIIFLFIISLFSAEAFAAPANDNFADAQLLTGAAGSIGGTTLGATREAVEFNHTASQTVVYRTVWFRYIAYSGKPVAFEVSSANGFDAALAVYRSEGTSLYTVSRNNDTNGNLPRVEFKGEVDNYYIVVGAFGDANAPGGDFTLNWAQSEQPTNDNFAGAQTLQQFPAGSVAATNFKATREANEPFHIGNSDKSVWFNFTNPTAVDYSITFTTVESYEVDFDSTLTVYQGATLQTLQPIVKNDNTEAFSKSRVTFLAKAGATYRIAVDSKNGGFQGSIILRWDVTKAAYNTDFQVKYSASEIYYKNSTDVCVFRPSNGTWYWLESGNIFRAAQFGQAGDQPVPADYDGDARTDLAVTRSVGNLKYWFISNSFDGSFRAAQFGSADDKAVPGDYDFDGRMDIAVFRPSNGFWYVLRSSDGNLIAAQFGQAGDIPVLGDFKNTGAGADFAVFRPSNGTWYIAKSNSNPGQNFDAIQFGTSGDKPVAADYDNDGKTDVAVFRPSNGTWYSVRSRNNQFQAVQWGAAGDIPQPGDYDLGGGNDDDFAVYRPGDRTWYVLKAEGSVMQSVQFGAAGDILASSLQTVPQ